MVIVLTEEVVQSGESGAILKVLEGLTKLCQDEGERGSINPAEFINLEPLLRRMIDDKALKDEILVEAYRFLRNSVVACRVNQDLIRDQTGLIPVTKCCLELCCSLNEEEKETGVNEKRLVAIRCSLQFLANCMVDNVQNCLEVSSFLETLGKLMKLHEEDEKIIQYAAMIIHLGLKQSPKNFIEGLDSFKIIKVLLNNLQLEFVIYSIESMLKMKEVTELYEGLDPEDRIKFLTFLTARIDLLSHLQPEFVSSLKTSFVERSDFILRSKVDDRDNLFCWEIAVLLEVLCVLSAEDKVLQAESALLTTTLCLLRQIHEVGKANPGKENVFSPVDDLGKLTSKSTADLDADDIRAHPTFQFKAHLIRLIANLCHQNKCNQDKVRDLECLPIILDNCKIDARNPFINQWSILAIRNLCEGNQENQVYINEVQRVDTEALLPKLELVDLS